MKVQILVENRTGHPACMAEFGLSVYIETGERKLLFDLGASDLFLHNAKGVRLDLEQVDTVVISHGHFDHTGGVPSFCKINRNAKIFLHEKALSEAYAMENGKMEEEPCSILWTAQQREQVRDRLVYTAGAEWLTEDIVISGTIPGVNDSEITDIFYLKQKDGSLTEDPMDHEQFLAVRERDENGVSRGIFVFSGCSHRGVIPCLNYAKTLYPGEKLLGFLAGMHLYNTDADKRKAILMRVAGEEMEYVLPVHCTGIHAICDAKQILGERCVLAGAGDQFTF